MDPYTPRPRPGGRKKNLGLSQKEYTKVRTCLYYPIQPLTKAHHRIQVAGTIASVRRTREYLEHDWGHELGPNNGIGIGLPRDGASMYAYYHDKLYVHRPIAHRASLGREETSFIAETSFVRAPLNSRVPSGAPLPKDKGKGKAREDSLQGLSIETQEALILEDLLFVLMVCFILLGLSKHVFERAILCELLKYWMFRGLKGHMSRITPITLQKTMIHCKASVSSWPLH